MNETLNALKKLVGQEIYRNKIVCCFQASENVIISGLGGGNYLVYKNNCASEQYKITVDVNNVIATVIAL